MNTTHEIPVIFRNTKEGSIIALLPTMPVGAINSACTAYSKEHGFFASDISIMHLTTHTDHDNVWPILAKLIQEGIKPLRVYKRILQWMNEERIQSLTSTNLKQA